MRTELESGAEITPEDYRSVIELLGGSWETRSHWKNWWCKGGGRAADSGINDTSIATCNNQYLLFAGRTYWPRFSELA
jgi:hypothetical protein